jgi:RNA polymerase sigma-70 factor (ECF subfamily)
MKDIFNQNMVPAFNEGDEKFVIRWYTSYFPGILNSVTELTGESSETLDLALEAVTRMLEHKGEFQTIKNIEGYLKKVIESVCDEYKDERKYKKTYSRNISDYLKNLAVVDREKAVVREKFRTLNYLAIEKLPRQCKTVYNLSCHEELSYKEIAQQLNISVKAVEHHKSAAFKKLRLEYYQKMGKEMSMFLFVILLLPFIIYQLIQKLLS